MSKTLLNIQNDPTEKLISVFNDLYPKQKEISEAFERFIIYNEDPKNFECVRKEIAESWLRSRYYGVAHNINPFYKKMEPSKLKEILRENRILVRVVNSVLSKELAFLRHQSGFDVFLYDKNCILLSNYVSNKNAKYSKNQEIDCTGFDCSEQSIGTSSHSLCLLLDEPFLILPTENYNKLIQHVSTAVSVPIHDPNGDTLGVLAFIYSEANNVYLIDRSMLSGMISFQLSVVKKIEYTLKKTMPPSITKVEKKFSFFETASSLTNDSLIAIDRNGKILHLNSIAENLLGLTEEQCTGKNIVDIFGKDAENIINLPKDKSYLTNFSSNGFITIDKNKYSVKIIPNDMAGGAFIQIKPYKPSNTSINKIESNHLNAIYTFSDILGASPEIEKTKHLSKKFASSPFNILLLGESGTGKELFAHAIHNASRPDGPFITINCAAMPRELIESELFGYEGGSFTGADPKGRPGKLEMANGGTLFLDEIGDMPMDLQPILLRCIENKMVMRIGGNRNIPTDFRVIAATNKNIQELISQNLFRSDLYFRLSSLKILIPPLRDRGTDILLLAHHFIRKICEENILPLYELEPSVKKAFMAYKWPGNIRELQNVINAAISLADDGIIKLSNLPAEIIKDANLNEMDLFNDHTNTIKTLKEIEKKAIQDALKLTGHNVKKAAEILGISRTTLYEKMKKMNDE